ncbi:MAG: aminopeptidase P N-terminal domain-containing protein [Planctomycetota bacterium]
MSRATTVLLLLLLLLGAAARAQETPTPPRPREGREQPAPEDERCRPTDLEALRAAAFAPERLRARRRALLAGLPEDAVVVIAGPPAESDILGYRPEPNLLYLSGQTDPSLTLLLSKDEDVIFAPERDKRWERWNGERLAVGSPQAAASGFGEVVAKGQRKARVLAALERHKGGLFLLGVSPAELGLEGAPQHRSPAPALARLRQVKDAGELALLERAADITCAALGEAAASVRPGQYEYEVEAVIEYLFARYGAQRPGFTSIVGSGPNSCVLHYGSNRRRIGAGELVVMDVGAELFGYTADITRTVPSSGAFSPRQREIYELVLAAQKAGFAAVRPGATLGDVDAAARKVIKDAGYGSYFAHFTSHWLGLDVHDVGEHRRALEPGMVLTVEPGIYLSKEDLGVRIEDYVVVTKDGCRVLSDGVPRTVAALEALARREGVGKLRVTPLPPRAPVAPKPSGARQFELRLR